MAKIMRIVSENFFTALDYLVRENYLLFRAVNTAILRNSIVENSLYYYADEAFSGEEAFSLEEDIDVRFDEEYASLNNELDKYDDKYFSVRPSRREKIATLKMFDSVTEKNSNEKKNPEYAELNEYETRALNQLFASPTEEELLDEREYVSRQSFDKIKEEVYREEIAEIKAELSSEHIIQKEWESQIDKQMGIRGN